MFKIRYSKIILRDLWDFVPHLVLRTFFYNALTQESEFLCGYWINKYTIIFTFGTVELI